MSREPHSLRAVTQLLIPPAAEVDAPGRLAVDGILRSLVGDAAGQEPELRAERPEEQLVLDPVLAGAVVVLDDRALVEVPPGRGERADREMGGMQGRGEGGRAGGRG